MKKAVYSDKVPKPIGPYSAAVIYDKLVFCSGQIPIDFITGEIVSNKIEDQARRALENLAVVLEAAGSSPDNALKITVYLKDMNHFGVVNGIYAEFFKGVLPARAAFEVARLPKDALIEVEAIAYID